MRGLTQLLRPHWRLHSLCIGLSVELASKLSPVHKGAFCQFLFRWVYYYGNNKSTGKETAKTHLCAVLCCASTEAVAAQARVVVLMLHVYLYFGLRLLLAVHLQWLHATPLLAWLQVYALIA